MLKTEVWKLNTNNDKESKFYCEAIPQPIAEMDGMESIIAAADCGEGLGIVYYLRKDKDHPMTEVSLLEAGISRIHGKTVYLYKVEFSD
jgi:hypothetical protein